MATPVVDDTLEEICCSGYIFYMSDGSRFPRFEVERVAIADTSIGRQSVLSNCVPDTIPKRELSNDDNNTVVTTNRSACVVETFHENTEDDTVFGFHICKKKNFYGVKEANIGDTAAAAASAAAPSVLYNDCTAWTNLSCQQQDVLTRIQNRVNIDRATNRDFTCSIVEGPGGCGKTRLISHVMNHKSMNAAVFYVSVQNKRVQDFINSDCLDGESDHGVWKPIDLTPKTGKEIRRLVESGIVGRYAVSAYKLVLALGGLPPSKFEPDTTSVDLGIHYDLFKCRKKERNFDSYTILLVDEYTMHPPPLIHAILYYTMLLSARPVIMIMAGDRFQCGPVNWSSQLVNNELLADSNNDDANRALYTNDIRREFKKRLQYMLLELKMENLQRCKEDTPLGDCVKRLRAICSAAAEETIDGSCSKRLTNLVLARYCMESGVGLYRQDVSTDGVSLIRRIVPEDKNLLYSIGRSNAAGDEDEEFDTRGVGFELATDQPLNPSYDMLPLVIHFTELYKRLSEQPNNATNRSKTLCESVNAIRHLFPAFIVLANNTCNVFAETFLLSIYTQVQKRLLSTGDDDSSSIATDAAAADVDRLVDTLRRSVRRLTIENEADHDHRYYDPIQRQTLFVGMLYKMTATFKKEGGNTNFLCNGETVVLTSIVFKDSTLDFMTAVTVRKLNDDGIEYTIQAGENTNRMTDSKKKMIMPFVPYVTENIFQVQGYTMPRNAACFVDLVNASATNVYVAVSRFQNSSSIMGVVINV